MDGSTCVVGPAANTSTPFMPGTATPQVDGDGNWLVLAALDPNAHAVWQEMIAACFQGDSVCPSHQLAIVVDEAIQSAPDVRSPDVPAEAQIPVPGSTEEQAKRLAEIINGGTAVAATVPQPASGIGEASSVAFACESPFEDQFPGVELSLAGPSYGPTDWPEFPVSFAYPVTECTGFTDQEQVWAVTTSDGLVYFFSATVTYPSGTVDEVNVLGSVPLDG